MDQSQRHQGTFSWHSVVAFVRWCNAESQILLSGTAWVCEKARSEAVTLDGKENSREVWKTVSKSYARIIWPGFGSASEWYSLFFFFLLYLTSTQEGTVHISAVLFPEKKDLWPKLPRSTGWVWIVLRNKWDPRARINHKRGWLVCGGDWLIVLLVLFQAGLCPQQRIKKPGLICTSLFCLSLCDRSHCVCNPLTVRQDGVRPRTSLAQRHSPAAKEASATLQRWGQSLHPTAVRLQSRPQPLELVPMHGPGTTAAATGALEKSCPSINDLVFATW